MQGDGGENLTTVENGGFCLPSLAQLYSTECHLPIHQLLLFSCSVFLCSLLFQLSQVTRQKHKKLPNLSKTMPRLDICHTHPLPKATSSYNHTFSTSTVTNIKTSITNLPLNVFALNLAGLTVEYLLSNTSPSKGRMMA